MLVLIRVLIVDDDVIIILFILFFLIILFFRFLIFERLSSSVRRIQKDTPLGWRGPPP